MLSTKPKYICDIIGTIDTYILFWRTRKIFANLLKKITTCEHLGTFTKNIGSVVKNSTLSTISSSIRTLPIWTPAQINYWYCVLKIKGNTWLRSTIIKDQKSANIVTAAAVGGEHLLITMATWISSVSSLLSCVQTYQYHRKRARKFSIIWGTLSLLVYTYSESFLSI